MLKFARILETIVAEIIIREDSFNINRSYAPGIISNSLGGTAGLNEGFVDVIPFSRPINEGDVHSGGVFTPPLPRPAPDKKEDRIATTASGDLMWGAWHRRQARIEGKSIATIVEEMKTEVRSLPPVP